MSHFEIKKKKKTHQLSITHAEIVPNGATIIDLCFFNILKNLNS